jgi:hypothetical protein
VRNHVAVTTSFKALADLRGNPKSFLQQYYLKISRSRDAGETAYWLSAASHLNPQGQTVYDRVPRPGRILGNLHMHESKTFKLDPFGQGPQLAGQGVIVFAYHVPVVQSNTLNVAAIPATRVARAGPVPDIMVTTLLNGCTFVCQEVGDNVLMAHVQPAGGLRGSQLATDIASRGAFNNAGAQAGPLHSFGANVYDSQTEEATIVGVRSGRRWHVLAQIHLRGHEKRILRVVEVFTGSA